MTSANIQWDSQAKRGGSSFAKGVKRSQRGRRISDNYPSSKPPPLDIRAKYTDPGNREHICDDVLFMLPLHAGGLISSDLVINNNGYRNNDSWCDKIVLSGGGVGVGELG
ncbi:hypothetical protein AAFF_G00012720 [Aldrovandia affinis]|uniref:Uncharacterized protein n=1 Tax=Aldrovandia affinis TaxID=143900 RepID=A0AAD7S6P4_9TELE|nr:hypothetical protein AAFF_G00012720 [Aldrovandia affinis]